LEDPEARRVLYGEDDGGDDGEKGEEKDGEKSGENDGEKGGENGGKDGTGGLVPLTASLGSSVVCNSSSAEDRY